MDTQQPMFGFLVSETSTYGFSWTLVHNKVKDVWGYYTYHVFDNQHPVPGYLLNVYQDKQEGGWVAQVFIANVFFSAYSVEYTLVESVVCQDCAGAKAFCEEELIKFLSSYKGQV